MESLATTVAIAGAGPAGLMLGLLLARAGVDTIVIEKHGDFLRDFRGDTIHPSTLELMRELGVLEKLLKRPHQEAHELTAEIGKEKFRLADFTHLPTRCKFIGFMPQWDFLDFLAQEARSYPCFRLMMDTGVVELLERKRRIAGVRVRTAQGRRDIVAALTIGADGRTSVVREKARLRVRNIGAPFDVLWLKLPAEDGDPEEPVGRIQGGQFFIMLYRGEYWQCAMVIPKGGFDQLKAEGLTGFRSRLRTAAGFARDRVDAIQSFDDVKLLTVKVDRLNRWARRGLLCIGDAAHAMSPVGGVGINLAIQDAVAAANLLIPVLNRHRVPSLSLLASVQQRRHWPTVVTQWFQVVVQNRVLAPSFKLKATPKPPLILRLLNSSSWLRRIPARLIGLGIRPEHIHDIQTDAPENSSAPATTRRPEYRMRNTGIEPG